MFMTAIPRARSEPTYRWASLKRWKQRARDWWPSWTSSEITALLVVFLERAGHQGLEAALDHAVRGHVQWGAAM